MKARCSSLMIGHVLLAVVGLAALEPNLVAAQPVAGTWMLEAGIWGHCATIEREGVLHAQSFWSRRPFAGAGLLNVTAGGCGLYWKTEVSTARYYFSAPGQVYLHADGTFEPLAVGEVSKRGHGRGGGLRIGPIHATSIDTRYKVVYTIDGALCVQVIRGRVEVVNESDSTSLLSLKREEAAFAAPPEEATLLTDEGTTVTDLQKLTGLRAEEQYDELRNVNARTRGNPRGPNIEQLTHLSIGMGELSSAEAGNSATTLADELSKDGRVSELAVRALYLAWLYANGVGDTQTSQILLQEMKSRGPSSYWTLAAVRSSQASFAPSSGD